MYIGFVLFSVVFLSAESFVIGLREESDHVQSDLESEVEDAIRSFNAITKANKEEIRNCNINLEYVRSNLDDVLGERDDMKEKIEALEAVLHEKSEIVTALVSSEVDLQNEIGAMRQEKANVDAKLWEIQQEKGHFFSFGKFRANKPLESEDFEKLIGLVDSGASFKVRLDGGCADVGYSIWTVERVLVSNTGNVVWMYFTRDQTTFGIQISNDLSHDKVRNGNFWIGSEKAVCGFEAFSCGSNDDIVGVGKEWVDFEILVRR